MKIDDIISATAKTFIKEQGIVFEDWQLAWLFYHSDRGCRWIHAALNEIAERTQDALLKDQIAFLISTEQKQLNAFKHNAGNAVYILKEQFPGDYGLTRQGCYTSYSLAEKAAKMLQYPRAIEKVRIVQDEQDVIYEGFDEFIYDSLGKIHYDESGEINYIFSCEADGEDWGDHHSEEMFCDRYFDFHHPFHTGDIVKRVDGDDTSIGIIGTNPYRERVYIGDFSNSGILVNTFDRETGIMWDSDTYENPYLFDYLDISPNTDDIAEQIILEWSSILKGKGGSMQYIQDGCQRIREIYEDDHKAQYITGFRLRDNRHIRTIVYDYEV